MTERVLDYGGTTIIAKDFRIAGSPGSKTGANTNTTKKTYSGGINTKQAVNNVHDTAPTAAELTTSFGAAATLGRGFVGTVDDADGDVNNYLVWTSDASFFYLKGTKAL